MGREIRGIEPAGSGMLAAIAGPAVRVAIGDRGRSGPMSHDLAEAGVRDAPMQTAQPAEPAEPGDARLVAALRAGDEAAFLDLVARYQRSMVRVARLHVPSDAVAEEVVQETWIAVLRGLDRFEGRSSLRTWIFRILTNQAKTRGERERRTVPLSALVAEETGGDAPAVDPWRFRPADAPTFAGHWSDHPERWGDVEGRAIGTETRAVVATTLEQLPRLQRLVMTLRDIEGWPSDEVCKALGITPANQRVLLHRARSRVRAALERYLQDAARV